MTIAALMLSGLSSYDRARVCVETWLPAFDWFKIHSHTPDPLNQLPITIVGNREGPRSCFLKRIGGLLDSQAHAVFHAHDTEWFMCCSDDNYVFRDNMEEMIRTRIGQCDTPLLVGGHTNKLRIANGRVVRYPSGGAGYLLNRRALHVIAHHMRQLLDDWRVDSNNDDVEDAFIGWAADQLSIPYLETPGFFGCNPISAPCERGCVMPERPVSIHYVDAQQMKAIHANDKFRS